LTVTAQLDTAPYLTGVKVSDQKMKDLPITRDPWHGEWNYTLHPAGGYDRESWAHLNESSDPGRDDRGTGV
jgi:hypothetical protein